MKVGLGLNTTIIHHDSGSSLQSQLPAGYLGLGGTPQFAIKTTLAWGLVKP